MFGLILAGSRTRGGNSTPCLCDPSVSPLFPSLGQPLSSLRVAVNDRVKDPNTGEWGDKANYFDVDVFGSQGENCARWLKKGRQVAIEGRLRWREWETPDGQKRLAVSIVAGNVQFVGPRGGGPDGGDPAQESPDVGLGDVPVDRTDPDDDIPF